MNPYSKRMQALMTIDWSDYSQNNSLTTRNWCNRIFTNIFLLSKFVIPGIEKLLIHFYSNEKKKLYSNLKPGTENSILISEFFNELESHKIKLQQFFVNTENVY